MPVYEDITRLVAVITKMREPFDSHGEKVADLAMDLATAYGCRPEDVYLIGVGARLHDVGKLLIRTDILNVPRKLTDAERAEIETHVQLGWQIVRTAGYDPTVEDIVLYHHERFDGKGYPKRLMKYQIPLSARMVTICDAYEAYTSQRPYRAAYAAPVAKAMVQKDIGSIYDPKLVDLFFEKVVR